MSNQTFDEWLSYGVTKSWVTLPLCDTHEGYPLTEEEAKEFDEGYDPCIPILRIWEHEIND